MGSNQKMLQVDNTVATKGAVNSLSKSDTTRLKSAFPNGPQYVTTPTKITSLDGNTDQANVEMSNSAYREAYKVACMIGTSTSAQQFDKNIDMSFGMTDTAAEPTPPNLLFLTPPGFPSKEATDVEAAQGKDGSTIAASGRGPNVNPILNLDGVPNVDNVAMADPKPDLVPISRSPNESTPVIAPSEDELPVADSGDSGA